MDYGRRIAMQRAKAKAQRARESDGVGVESKKQKRARKEHPFVNTVKYPLHDPDNKYGVLDYEVDWNDDVTETHSKYLSDTFDHKSAQLLVLPTGVGKTAVAVRTLGEMQEKLQKKQEFIVLASRAIIDKGNWQRYINTWNRDHPGNKLDPYLVDTFDRFASICANGNNLKEMIENVRNDCVIVIDEVHNYKNPVSKRSRQMQKLNFMTKLGLTATPITNDAIMDGASYLILGGKYRNKSHFMTETGLAGLVGERGRLLVYDEKTGQIRDWMWPYYGTFKKQLGELIYRPSIDTKDLDMPDVTNHIIQLEMNDDLEADIRSLGNAYNARMFDSVTDLMMAIVERVHEDEERLDHLMRIIKDESVRQPLIFYYNIAVRDRIADRFQNEGIEYQEVSGSSSFKNVDTKKNTPILMQYVSGSEGIELKESNTSVFYQNQASYSVLTQAKGRNVRRGMTHGVDHYYLISPVYYDQTLYERVQNREEVSNKMLEEITLETIGKSKSKV